MVQTEKLRWEESRGFPGITQQASDGALWMLRLTPLHHRVLLPHVAL